MRKWLNKKMSTKKKGLFVPVPRKNEMDNKMYSEIEKIAKGRVESTKENFKTENDMANYVKKQLEEKYKDRDLCWHVIVGRNFGGCITYKEKVMTYFYVGQIGFLVFATPDV